MKIEIHPAAQNELNDASAYCETNLPGLGGDFLAELNAAIERIARHPEIGAVVEVS